MQVTDYFSAIPIGLLIGVLGRLILPGRQRIGAFATFAIGIGAALLGTFIAGLLGVDNRAGQEWLGLEWDWIELAIQVTFAVIGIGVANVLTHTRLADGSRPRRRTRKRRSSRSS